MVKFVFSKRSVPVGTTVIFKVVNKGKISHDFKIAGKKTKVLQPGPVDKRSPSSSRRRANFPYLCTVFGSRGGRYERHLLRWRRSGQTAAADNNNANDDDAADHDNEHRPGRNRQDDRNMNMFEYFFQLSQTTIPSGQVTFR